MEKIRIAVSSKAFVQQNMNSETQENYIKL